jgi:hypothetical protein
MALTLMLAISWLLLTIWFNYPQKMSRRESIYLFMVILSINISVSWILGYELKKIEIPKQTWEYLAYVLYRSLLVPLLPLMCINWMQLFRSRFKKALLVGGYLLAVWGIEVIGTTFRAYTFVDFHMLSAVGVAGVYLLLDVLLLRWYRRVFADEEVEMT